LDRIDFAHIAIEMKGITKKFGDFTANDDIDLTVHKGEVHALLGENGAGKTTLMNQLYGLYKPTKGDIYINGKHVDVSNPNVAISNGIGMVHQHFMLVKPFTVTENIILGMETVKFGGVLDIKKARKQVGELSEKYGLHVDPDSRVQDITVGMEQRVEILKALYRGAGILILDEPTAVLTPQEINDLINIIRNLTAEGKTIIIITHKLKEIIAAADYCTVIRRGKRIDTVEVSKVTEKELASMMVGREVNFKVAKEKRQAGKPILKIENLVVKDNRNIKQINGLTLSVKEGEILGLAGIDGNGQSELIEALTGLRPVESGKVLLHDNDITGKSPKEIIESRVCTIPEDRQKYGLVLEYNIAENLILENYHKKPFSKKGILNFNQINKFAKDLIEKFDVRPSDSRYKASELSGGNQQKVIIAREVTNSPDILIAFQPTRGLDVGAIEYVHKALVEQRNNGKAVFLVSLDLDEILNVADRIAVICEGRIVGIMDAENADENEIGLMMAGGKK
jgi:simple sugar transport system ATP-binding protein